MAFEELIGNEDVKNLLTNTIKNNKILHSYLFAGIEGIGKNIFAKEFAKMILCHSENPINCNKCKSCVNFKSENHPDFMQVNSEDGKTIKIEQIRFLQQKIAEKPVMSKRKVYIINDCETMTREAANSLLKTLEEPPKYAVIILITANESKLLTTIKSRCTKISFLPIHEKEIKKYIVDNNIEITSYMLKQCSGSIGDIFKIQNNKEIYEQIEKILEKLEKTNITEVWNEATYLYKEKEKIIEMLNYINIIFFEKYKLKNNEKYLNAIQIVEDTKKRINSNANYDMTIDYFLHRVWEDLK